MGAPRPPRPWLRRSGSGSGRSCPAGCCGRSGSGRPTRTGPKSVTRPEDQAGTGAEPFRAGRELRTRYTAADLAVFTRDEAARFVPRGDSDAQDNALLAWELLYRLEPE